MAAHRAAHPAQRTGGNKRTTDMREVVNALLYLTKNYLTKNGCRWRDIPGDFPAWETVCDSFGRWRDDGTWQAISRSPRRGGEVLHRR